MGDGRRPLRDRLHHVDLAEAALQRQPLIIDERAAAADDEDRDAVEVGVRHGRDHVGDAWSGGDDRDADLAGRARPAIGGVAGRLLVPRVDELHAVVHGGLEDRVKVAAVQREDALDARRLQHSNQDLAAVNLLCQRVLLCAR